MLIGKPVTVHALLFISLVKEKMRQPWTSCSLFVISRGAWAGSFVLGDTGLRSLFAFSGVGSLVFFHWLSARVREFSTTMAFC